MTVELMEFSDFNIKASYHKITLNDGRAVSERDYRYRGVDMSFKPWTRRVDDNFPQPEAVWIHIKLGGFCFFDGKVRRLEIKHLSDGDFCLRYQEFTGVFKQDSGKWYEMKIHTTKNAVSDRIEISPPEDYMYW